METLSSIIKNQLALIRWNKPVGAILLILPTWASLWSAAQGAPPMDIFILFTLGAIFTRSFGCVVNDICDQDIDRAVERTKQRPLATGAVPIWAALLLTAFLLFLSAGMVFFCHPLTIVLAIAAIPIIIIYPLSKRFFKVPQLILGVAFSWAVPMSYAAILGHLSRPEWPFLMLAIAAWTTAFDTQYALSDLEDDNQLNIYSAPKLFQSRVSGFIISCHVVTMIGLLLWAIMVPMTALYSKSIGLIVLTLVFVWQHRRKQKPEQGQRLFFHNQWWGILFWLWMVSVSIEHGLF